MDRIMNYLLGSRHRLLLSTVLVYILLVVIEGFIMDRESRVYNFENPYFELNLNNIDEFESRRPRDR